MKRIIFGLSLIFTLSILFTTTSCSRKSGCITAENAQVKTNRKGELPTRRGKSSLFPKQMRKKKRGKREGRDTQYEQKERTPRKIKKN